MEKDTDFYIHLSNTRDFRVLKQTDEKENVYLDQQHTATSVTVEAGASELISIVFWPCNVTEEKTAIVEFSNDDMGILTYHVAGIGKLPDIMDTIRVFSTVNSTASSSLLFVNPLLDPITVNVKLIADIDSDQAAAKSKRQKSIVSRPIPKPFSLLSAKTKYQVAPNGRLELPFTYHPVAMSKSTARIVLELSNQLKWIYTLSVSPFYLILYQGIPETAISQNIQNIQARVRESSTQDFHVTLDGYCKIDTRDFEQSISFALEVPKKQAASKENGDVLDELSLECLEKIRKQDSVVLKFRSTFEPKKASDCIRHLVVSNSNTGGRWRFPIRLQGNPPIPDDKITIECSLGKPSLISFNIACPSDFDTYFTAFFTHDSPSEFSIHPTSGVLQHGVENQFVLGYHASVYGKECIGTLVIEVLSSQIGN